MECPIAQQEVNDVAFVGLHPVELVRLDGADVQAVDVGGVEELLGPRFIFGDGGADQGGADLFDHLILRAFHHAGKRKHVLGVGKRRIRAGAVDERRPQKIVRVFLNQTAAVAILRGDFRNARLFEQVFDLVVHRFRRTGEGEGGKTCFGV